MHRIGGYPLFQMSLKLRLSLNRTYDQIGSKRKSITASAKENIFGHASRPTKNVYKGEKLKLTTT